MLPLGVSMDVNLHVTSIRAQYKIHCICIDKLCERPKISIEYDLKNAFSYVKMFIQSNTRRYVSWSTCTILVYNVAPHQHVVNIHLVIMF
jgi:hypothetical protein